MALRTEPVVANFAGAGVEALPMSPRGPPSSVGASELERLALDRRGSRGSEMGVTTRSSAKREAANRGESSKDSAGAKKGKEKASASSAAATRKSGRTSKSAVPQHDPKDDDDDDEDDSDDDSDDDGDIEKGRLNSMAIWMIYDPSFPSYREFCSSSLDGRSEASAMFRALVVASLKSIRSNADLARLNTACQVQGPEWSRKLAQNMEQRWYLILNGYRTYYASHGKEAQGTRVEDTIKGIKSLFDAVADILSTFRNMRSDAPQRLVNVLLNVLEAISAFNVDARPAGAPSYAGGSQQFEYNLLLRFSAFQGNWLTCLEVIRRLHAVGYAERFIDREDRWSALYTKLYNALAQTTPQSPGDSNEMLRGLHQRLTAMGVNMT